jgi:hypothetical protein
LAITHIHTFLVQPRAPEGPVDIAGAAVPLEGKLFVLLNDIYSKTDTQCNIDISFNPTDAGEQQNETRDALLAYLAETNLERAHTIAQRLQAATDKRSGMGLLFLMRGQEEADHKVVISRFPADNGILAEMNVAGLNVEFLERVFMKSAHSYKAVAYRGPSMVAGFWQGRAIDRQVGDPAVRLSDYWIRHFLRSDFKETAAGGTRRLALALRGAVKTAGDVETKQALTAAATLAASLNGQRTSLVDFQERFGLSEAARQGMNQTLKTPAAATTQFVFDAEEFGRQIAFRSVELDSGAILTAESGDFDRVFEQEAVDDGGRVRYSTTGVVVGQRLRSRAAT